VLRGEGIRDQGSGIREEKEKRVRHQASGTSEEEKREAAVFARIGARNGVVR
jgi:hypothetical protein